MRLPRVVNKVQAHREDWKKEKKLNVSNFVSKFVSLDF